MADLPSGTVTFLFSDIEGSTQLLERHGGAMGSALARHHAIFNEIVQRHRGEIFETVGDAVYAAFPTASNAVAAALDAHRALVAEDWGPIDRLAVRIALHTGTVERRGDHYVGPPLFRAARLQALGYGEQTLISGLTARLAADALPGGASLRDLGSHRLKDLGVPEQVYQLLHPELRVDFPALKSLDAHPHNLPAQLSTFIGREGELREVRDLLRTHRLVTLLGAGGIGKTRLALQLGAESLEDYADGVFLVDLSALRDPELLPSAIATTLGLREQRGQSISSMLADHLTDKEILLVLDNLEQLLPTAAAHVGQVLTSAGVRVLATSRAPLRLRGEQEYAVPPLAAGAPGRTEADAGSAVALFLERGRAIRPDLFVDSESGPLIVDICERLDGLPLAIELAAARLRLHSLRTLHDGLTQRLSMLSGGGARDLPERHATLRAAISWSEKLLTPSERRLFARLGVFASACRFEAIEAIAGPDLDGSVLDALMALVEQSLVRRADGPDGEPRYTMLETVKEFAVERLSATGEAEAIRQRHASWLADLAEAEMERYSGRGHGRALDAIGAYVGDFRAALTWGFDRGDRALAIRIAVALGRYWDERDTSEGIKWLEHAASVASTDPMTQIQIVRPLGWLHGRRGDEDAAARDFGHLLRLGRDLGDRQAILSALSNLAFIALSRGQLDKARAHLDELDPMDDGEDAWGRAISARMRGRLEAESGNFGAADDAFRRSEAEARRSGDPGNSAATLHDYGMALLWRGDHARAQEQLSESARLATEVDFKGVLGPALIHLAAVAARGGIVQVARAALVEALDVTDALGGADWLEDLLDTAAWVAIATGDNVGAARLLGAAAVRWDRIEPTARTTDRKWHGTLVTHVEHALGNKWGSEANVGNALSPADAIRMARQVIGTAAATADVVPASKTS